MKTSPERYAKIKKWQKEHAEQVRVSKRASAARNKDKKKAYAQAHADEMREYFKRRSAARKENPELREIDRERARIGSAAYRSRHPEKALEYRKANPRLIQKREFEARRRARKRQNAVEPIDYKMIFERDKGICQLCGGKVLVYPNYDHIVPLALGGPHASWNLQLTHRICNERRGVGRIPAQMRLAI